MINEEYKDPRWQKKRLEVMGAAGFECQCCGADDKTLNVHHVNYDKSAKMWDYDCYRLKCLCDECHEKQHWLIVMFRNYVSMLRIEDLSMLEMMVYELMVQEHQKKLRSKNVRKSI